MTTGDELAVSPAKPAHEDWTEAQVATYERLLGEMRGRMRAGMSPRVARVAFVAAVRDEVDPRHADVLQRYDDVEAYWAEAKRERTAKRRAADKAAAAAAGLTLAAFREQRTAAHAAKVAGDAERDAADLAALTSVVRRRASWNRYKASIPKTPERRAAQAAYMREYRARKKAAAE